MPKRLNPQQRCLLNELINNINAGDQVAPRDEFPNWALDYPLWSAGENMSGYLPDTPYCLFMTERAARGYCRELEREPGGKDYVSDYMPITLREVLS